MSQLLPLYQKSGQSTPARLDTTTLSHLAQTHSLHVPFCSLPRSQWSSVASTPTAHMIQVLQEGMVGRGFCFGYFGLMEDSSYFSQGNTTQKIQLDKIHFLFFPRKESEQLLKTRHWNSLLTKAIGKAQIFTSPSILLKSKHFYKSVWM